MATGVLLMINSLAQLTDSKMKTMQGGNGCFVDDKFSAQLTDSKMTTKQGGNGCFVDDKFLSTTNRSFALEVRNSEFRILPVFCPIKTES